MRVLHIGKYYPPYAGGMEYFLADLAKAQARVGMDVSVLVHADGRGTGDTRPLDGDAVSVYRAPCYGRLMYAPLSPAFPIWLDRVIREQRPDLLHLHLPNTSAFSALAVPAARRLPWVIHWHSDVVSSLIDRRLAAAYRLYRPFEQMLLARSEKIIGTSPAYLESSLALRSWSARCVAIPLGLDSDRIAEPTPKALAEAQTIWGGSDAFRVLTIGRLTYYKGHEVLIRASRELEATQALIVGTGDLGDHLEEVARNLSLGNRVRFAGYQSDAVLGALLRTCDVVCLPSVERTEAFGLVQLEAMRFEKPVIVSDIPGSGTGWVARRAGNALLVEPGNPSALAAQINRLRADSALRQGLGAAGRLALERELGIPHVAEQISNVYRQVVDSGKRNAASP